MASYIFSPRQWVLGRLPLQAIKALAHDAGKIVAEKGLTLAERAERLRGLLEGIKGNKIPSGQQSETLKHLAVGLLFAQPVDFKNVEEVAPLLNEPSKKEIQDYTVGQLEIENDEALKAVYEKLTDIAKEGLFLLLVDGRLEPERLRRFLRNPAVQKIPQGLERILMAVVFLYRQGVQNYEAAFISTKNDKKFLSTEEARIQSLLSEYIHALRYSRHSDVAEVHLDANYRIDWDDLTSEETAFLSRHVDSYYPPEIYRSEMVAKIDMTIVRRKGCRLVEIKSSRCPLYRLDAEKQAKALLQVFRYALAVRRYRLEGVEYVIDADQIDRDFEDRLRQAFRITGVPFEIRHENETARIVERHRLEPLGSRKSASQERRSSLPPVPREIDSEEELTEAAPAPVRKETVRRHKDRQSVGPRKESALLPWTAEMQRFLDRMIPNFKVIDLKLSEFEEILQNQLRVDDQEEVIARINQWLMDGNPNRREQISPLLQQFKRAKKNTLAKSAIQILVRIAATAVGENLPVQRQFVREDPSGGLAQEIALLGKFSKEIESCLEAYLEGREAEGLDDVGALLEEGIRHLDHDGLNYLSELLEKWTPQGLIFRQWTVRQVYAAMKETGEIGWKEDLVTRLDRAIQRYDSEMALIEKFRTEFPLETPSLPIEPAPPSPDLSP